MGIRLVRTALVAILLGVVGTPVADIACGFRCERMADEMAMGCTTHSRASGPMVTGIAVCHHVLSAIPAAVEGGTSPLLGHPTQVAVATPVSPATVVSSPDGVVAADETPPDLLALSSSLAHRSVLRI